MNFSITKNIFVVLSMMTFLLAGMFFVLSKSEIKNNKNFSNQIASLLYVTEKSVTEKIEEIDFSKKIENPPEIINAVYVSGWSAGSNSYRNYLVNLLQNTEINAVVIDIKDSSGNVFLSEKLIPDINEFVKFLHKHNIYVIGRIAVFEDPKYAVAHPELAIYNKEKTTDILKPVLWKDYNGLYWLDPASKQVWDYNILLAKDAFSRGFDEINFDYIRFPSDGDIKNMGFPVFNKNLKNKESKQQVIKRFFKYLRRELSGEKISADLFGQTTIENSDMGIGQKIEDAFEYFDFVCPMVYPSHYAVGFAGYKNPAEYPYQVVKYSILNAQIKKKTNLELQRILYNEPSGSPALEAKIVEYNPPLGQLRPWLQDFDMGADYTASMIKSEIKAVKELGKDYYGFMMWNARNIYTKEAVLKE